MNNTLTEQFMNQSLFNGNHPKPVRNLVDNYVAPAGGIVGGGALSLIQALANIKREPRIIDIK